MISLRDVVTGFGNRDPLAEVWRRDLRGGSAEITGEPPLRYIGNGRPLTDYMLYGNAVQDGTPSPDAPVDATGSGVRTGNLCNVSNENTLTYTSGYNNFLIDDDTQSITITGNALFGLLAPVTPDTAYTVCANSTKYGLLRVREYSDKPSSWASTEFIQQSINTTIGSASNFTTTAQTKWIAVAFYFESVNAGAVLSDAMLNLGSTALPYEPYGYKLPLTVNGTEYPIYLGAVPTTRRVKKLVLTGEGYFGKNYADPDNTLYYLNFTNYHVPLAGNAVALCTHLTPSSSLPSSEAGIRVSNSGATLYINFGADVMNAQPSGNTVDGLKEYLATQYAAGTPVTIWYVLAEPETAIVNEPLMKIGEYADTISFAQSQVTMPTVSGANVLDVPTTVPPSQITIKGGIRSV